ncbi:MAG: diadenylate cyclase CdaA [Oscillospiraceae bacterium]|nr:diadenylate cyclase CdaA [Oscillospiraceae bacterium]
MQTVTIINFPSDILDILIITYLIYKVLSLTRSRSSAQIIKAVVFLLVLSYVSDALKLYALNYVVSKVIEVGIIALVVVFQPELRRVMERLGGSSVRSLLLPKARSADSLGTVTETVSACRSMSRQKIGALIVFERQNSLEEYFRTGTVVNADVSEELLKNIFFPKAALHDGAVIIRRDRIAAAGCVLPLTENANLSRDLGTRHRAAIGMSEHSDAVVVVVSEETGVISCVIGGVLRRYLTPETLERVLREELLEDSAPPVRHRLGELFGKMRNRKEEDDHAEK